MGKKWKRALLGYDPSSVYRHLSLQEAQFSTMKKKLLEQLQELDDESSRLSRRAEYLKEVLPNGLSPSETVRQTLGNAKSQDAISNYGLTASSTFKTVLFGFNKCSVKKFFRRLKSLQEDELLGLSGLVDAAWKIREELAGIVAEYERQLEGTDDSDTEFDAAQPQEPSAAQEPLTAPQELTAKQEPFLETLGIRECTDGDDAEISLSIQKMTSGLEPAEPEQVKDTPEEKITVPELEPVAGKVVAFRKRGEAPDMSLPVQSAVSGSEPGHQSAIVKPKAAVGMGFWEDAGDYLEQILQDTLAIFSTSAVQASASSAVAEPPLSVPASAAPFESSVKPLDSIRAERSVNPEPSPVQRAEIAEAANAQEAYDHSAAFEGKSSLAVSDEIRQLRRKYIVGKIAGEDLLDRSGRLIVGKNQPITEAVMLKADQEGKLSELIVNMIIPGLGE
ncbi:hypothetical protein [Ferviditalea candida]|uniref:Uncharacterized protein n=1 Tax=Ferviditalea candida TaxID=3108399 RepID=A0ABU5ZHL9_9BACL|nr:hypothetical protein [Paenibacillaceae bacterium T2]